MTNSNPRLERRYRRLLGLYPRRYREQHGDDMLGVLMADSDDNRSRPRLSARSTLSATLSWFTPATGGRCAA